MPSATITCRLTGVKGPAVRSHVLPIGLTIKNRGDMLFDLTRERPARRRQGGWYDDRLVTAEGEAILAKWDNVAISAFRKNGMLFSVRRDDGVELMGADYSVPAPQIEGVFRAPIENSMSIKLFGISMLWRAAASQRSEYDLVQLPAEVLDELRAFVVEERVPKYWEFPVVLGVFNNRYEFTDIAPHTITMRGVRFVRWCLDGVIMYVATRRRTTGGSRWRGLAVGHNASELMGLIMQYENGSQQRHTDEAFEDQLRRFGSPYRGRKIASDYPEYEFDELGKRVRRLTD